MPAATTPATPALRRTPLYERHLASGAQFSEVAGWEMPLWYPAGAVKEHRAVVQAAGLFDTGHMTPLLVEGAGVRDFLDYAFTRELSGLKPGRVGYGAFLDANGGVVDDAIVYPLDETRVGVVANASMGPALIEHCRALPGGNAFDYHDFSGRWCKFDLQGPRAARILLAVADAPDELRASFPFFSFVGDFKLEASPVTLAGEIPALISRTGYTGELGFEIFVSAEAGPLLWDRLLAAGAEDGLMACGYAARDSLRAGAVLPLSHQDIGAWPFVNHPWPWALPTDGNGSYNKPFHGMEALVVARPGAMHTLPFVGRDPRKPDTATARVVHDGREVGTVLTAVADMAIGRVEGRVLSLSSPEAPEGFSPRGLVCGFVKVERALEAGTEISLVDGRRSIPAEIVKDIRPARTARRPWKENF